MAEEPETPEQEDFATLFAGAAAGARVEVGQAIRGRIIHIGPETVFVDVHDKGEALMDRAELEDEEGRLRVGVGDEIEATVVAAGDEIRLSHKLLRGVQAREALEAAARTGLPVEGRVTAVIRGGYEVMVAGLRAFCPFSQMDLRRVESPEELVRRVLEFRVTKYGERGRNIVLSRRQILEELAARAAEETRAKIVPGALLPGTVSSLTDFGAFVDLGGVQGLVPASEVSHSRVGRPADRLQTGQAVTVKVLKVDGDKGRISLSLKALEADPWGALPATVRERQVLQGRIARVTDFGVFVELLPGVDGLLHVTEIPRSQQGAMKKAAAGTELTVMVVSVDREKRRIALALAPEGMTPGEHVESDLAVGAVMSGTVERVEPFGVFVRLGPGQVGLIPSAELATGRGANQDLGPGATVEVAVLAIEEGGRRIRLSRVEAQRRAEQAEAQAYRRDSSGRSGGFGLTLGEVLRQSRRK